MTGRGATRPVAPHGGTGTPPARRMAALWCWAAVAGALAAAAPVVFHWLVQQAELLANGRGGGLEAVAGALPPWRRVVVCTLGGLLAGLLFTPSLFLGAAAGNLLAQWAALWLPTAWVGDPRTLSVIGMASVLTAVTHAPLITIVMVLEMTQQFQLTVPVMLACGVAYAVSTQCGARPLYGNPIELSR